MLSIYRRHREKCSHAEDRISKKCRCALWVTGTLEGKPVRESLKTRNWDRAEQLKREREAGKTTTLEEESITLDYALKKYLESCEQRCLANGTLRKYRTFQATLTKFAIKHSLIALASFDSLRVRDYMTQRKLGANSAASHWSPVVIVENWRNVWKMSAAIVGLSLLVKHVMVHDAFTIRWGLTAIIGSVFLFYRYLKFFRQYSYELFNAYRGTAQP